MASSTATNPALNELAAQITAHCETLTNFLTAHNLPHPSFAADGPPMGPQYAKIQGVQMELIAAAEMLRDLVMGPDQKMLQATLVCFIHLPSSL